MSGRSQAIQLPASLRMDTSEVLIEQIGNGLWIQPKKEPIKDMGAWLESFYASTEPLPEDFLAERGADGRRISFPAPRCCAPAP